MKNIKLTPDSLSTKNKRGAFVFMKLRPPGATRTGVNAKIIGRFSPFLMSAIGH
ncbi:hypothetical protein H6S13_26430 (plasmid) [Escherichia coli]|nr:hypothetical protein H6S13_26430 [Escherichia coli]